MSQQTMIGGGGNGIARVEITNEEFPVFKREAYLAAIQNFTERAAKDGQQDPALENSRSRVPVNIEVRGETRFIAVLENVHPPAILAACCHVVRNDIQNQSHLTLEQFILQVLKILDGADFRIDLSGIGDVVTVRASFAAGLNRRSVDVRNSEFRQIVNENDGI